MYVGLLQLRELAELGLLVAREKSSSLQFSSRSRVIGDYKCPRTGAILVYKPIFGMQVKSMPFFIALLKFSSGMSKITVLMTLL